MNTIDKKDTHLVQQHAYEFFQIRALCDEIMESLCQARALLHPVNDEGFFHSLDVEVLRHYFYALDTIIDGALRAKDDITRLVDHWEKQEKEPNVSQLSIK